MSVSFLINVLINNSIIYSLTFRLLKMRIVCAYFIFSLILLADGVLRERKAQLVRKHLKRLKKLDGAIKLVGGRGEFEGKNHKKLNSNREVHRL